METAHSPVGVLPRTPASVDVRRYLVVANQTLMDPVLTDLVRTRCCASPSRIHVLVPHQRRLLPFLDPVLGVPMDAGIDGIVADQAEMDAARQRLQSFLDRLVASGTDATGEVVAGDPVAAARALQDSPGFDEVIVSTLPAGLSAWLRLDLPSRLARAFDLPVVTLTQPG
jgi:hypothetical protein